MRLPCEDCPEAVKVIGSTTNTTIYVCPHGSKHCPRREEQRQRSSRFTPEPGEVESHG